MNSKYLMRIICEFVLTSSISSVILSCADLIDFRVSSSSFLKSVSWVYEPDFQGRPWDNEPCRTGLGFTKISSSYHSDRSWNNFNGCDTLESVLLQLKLYKQRFMDGNNMDAWFQVRFRNKTFLMVLFDESAINILISTSNSPQPVSFTS